MIKVGDKFVVKRQACGFAQGAIVTFSSGNLPTKNDGTGGSAVFAGPNDQWKNAWEDGVRIEGAWLNWDDVEPVASATPTPLEVKVDRYREMYMSGLAVSITSLQTIVHQANVDAGWWTDLATGEAIDPVKFGPEKIALMHSELSEALEGLRKGLQDDKLPHRPMAEVEIADCIIRCLDWCGAMGYDVGGAIVEKLEYNASRADHKIENRLKAGGKTF